MWHEGTISIPNSSDIMAHFWIKTAKENDAQGISGGRIISLIIKIGTQYVANYDNGDWDIAPDKNNHNVMYAYAKCLEFYN